MSRRCVCSLHELARTRIATADGHVLIDMGAFEERTVLLLLGGAEEEIAMVDGPVQGKGLILHVLDVEVF